MTTLPFQWRYIWIVLGLAAVLVAAVPAYAQDDDDGGGGDGDDRGCAVVVDDDDGGRDGYCDSQAIVRLSRKARIGELAKEHKLTVLDSIPARRTYLVSFRPTARDRAVANKLDRDQRTVWAELNYADRAPEGSPRYVYRSSPSAPTDPNTAYAPELLGVPDASCVTGAGTTVAVVDTGVQPDHPAFSGNVLPGRNVLGNNDQTADDGSGPMSGHGTHVAGIVDQVAPGARILPIKALDDNGVGDAFYLAKALDYAGTRNADVVNLSLGTTFDSRAVGEAVAATIGRGDLIVAAAGNSGAPSPLEYPASIPQVLSVASTDQNDRRSDFSSHNTAVDISAPGTEIVSAFPGNEYRTWSGTSMATPWVSGAVALLFDNNLTQGQVGQQLKRTADDVEGNAAGMGEGRLNVGAAVGCAGR